MGLKEKVFNFEKIAAQFEGIELAREVITEVRSVSTIFPQLDEVTKVDGWPIDRFALVHGPSNHGKALPVDAPILTPKGWVPIGRLAVGDPIVGRDGKSHSVIGVFPQGELDLFRVTFSDRTSIECCDRHLWSTATQDDFSQVKGTRKSPWKIRSLAKMQERFKRNHYAIPIVKPVEFEPMSELPIPPYLLGLLLGDGSFLGIQMKFTNPELDLQARIAELADKVGDAATQHTELDAGFRGGHIRESLKVLGLYGCRSWEKHIPDIYLFASIEDRLELLRGLIDSDGYVTKEGGLVEYTSTSRQLADGVEFLARSLGAYVVVDLPRCTTYSYLGVKKIGRESIRMRISFEDSNIVPVSSDKHRKRWKSRKKQNRKTIESITFSRKSEAVCIAVDAPDSLYVTQDFIVTHNSQFCHGLGLSFLKRGHFYLFIDAELTTPKTWLRVMMGDYLDSPQFFAKHPQTYEDTRKVVYDFCMKVKALRDDGDIPEDTTALIVLDSITKLVSKDMFDKLKKLDEDGDIKGHKGKTGIDTLGGRAGQYMAGLNTAWLREVVPLLHRTGTAMVVITRETEEQTQWGTAIKTIGGKDLFFDSSLVVRVQRKEYIKDGDTVCGERHSLQVRKTKIGGKDEIMPMAFYHWSEGNLEGIPPGFDVARDLIELGLKHGILTQSGAWVVWGKNKLGNGVNAAIRKLYAEPELLEQLNVEVRSLSKRASKESPDATSDTV